MNATYSTPGLGHRLGRTFRRGLNKLKGFELGVARRAGEKFPSIGYTVARILFLILKLVVLATILFFSAWLVACLLILIVLFSLMSASSRFEDNSDDESFIRGTCSPDDVNNFYHAHDHPDDISYRD